MVLVKFHKHTKDGGAMMNTIMSLVLALIPLVTAIINLIVINKKIKLFMLNCSKKKKSTNRHAKGN